MAGASPSSLPDPARIEALAGYGMSVAEIASIYRLEQAMVRQTFAHELEAGEAKTRARWKEVHRDDDRNQPVIVQIQRFAEDL